METSAFGVVHKAMSKETKQRKKNAQKTELASGVTATGAGLTATALGAKAKNKALDAGSHNLSRRLAFDSANLTRSVAETHARAGKIDEARDLGRKYGAALDTAERHKNSATLKLKSAKKLSRRSLGATGVGVGGLIAMDRAGAIADKPKSAGKFGFGTKK